MRNDDERIKSFLKELARPDLTARCRREVTAMYEASAGDPKPSGGYAAAVIARPSAIRDLIRHARKEAINRPGDAAVIGEVAVRLAHDARTRRGCHRAEPARIRLEADARRELADILKRCNQVKKARTQALRARTLYAHPKLAPHRDQARLDLTLGQILFDLGERERGVAIINDAAVQLRDRWRDTLGYSKAMTIIGALFMRADDYVAALPYFHEAMLAGSHLADDFTIASNVYNNASCRVELGLPDAAAALEKAREMFASLGLREPLLRCDALAAVLLYRQGRVKEAISELYKALHGFEALDVPNTSARLKVRLAEWLIEQKRFTEIPLAVKGVRKRLLTAGLSTDAARLDALLGTVTAA